MIAKLIVRGPDRGTALQKMVAALESYEIAGPVTNIEFLKRVCRSPAFLAGQVETGYIDKYRQELFEQEPPPVEVLGQVAVGLLLEEQSVARTLAPGYIPFSPLCEQFQERSYVISELQPDGTPTSKSVKVAVQERAANQLDMVIGGQQFSVSTKASGSNRYTTYFPHTRLDTTFIRDEDRITLWQQGRQYKFVLSTPSWVDKALGVKVSANSVLTPMPCKVLRVEVKQGDHVKKDQVIAVIESMKMETVIRSPMDGIISKVKHQSGVSLSIGRPDSTDLYRICARQVLLWLNMSCDTMELVALFRPRSQDPKPVYKFSGSVPVRPWARAQFRRNEGPYALIAVPLGEITTIEMIRCSDTVKMAYLRHLCTHPFSTGLGNEFNAVLMPRAYRYCRP